MEVMDQEYLSVKAIEVIKSSSADSFIKASATGTDNYEFVWARDCAVTGLAVLSNEIYELYEPLKQSLLLLQGAANVNGQIPSNLQVNKQGNIIGVSFGGPVGRVDSSFWWILASVYLLKQTDDEAFRCILEKQCDAIFKLADCWEFNGKDLMYVPMSSNWADEYVTHGYVLYDQLLRYWALLVSAKFFKRTDWFQKANEIKLKIKEHYLLEGELENTLYTISQQKSLKNFDLSHSFIASFSPGDRVERYDGWSIALLFLLDIPSDSSKHKLNIALNNILRYTNGVPAFWPVINEQDPIYQALLLNHSFKFKNTPGHFHNGGIWPVVNGFLIAGLECAGFYKTSAILMNELDRKVSESLPSSPFAEYFDYYNGLPGGVNNLCFSASGYLLATLATNNPLQFQNKLLFFNVEANNSITKNLPNAAILIDLLPLEKHDVTVISIAGESGSGKTTLSWLLEDVLIQKGVRVLIIHQDDYFKLPPQKNHKARLNDFSLVGPAEVRLELLDNHLKQLKTGQLNKISIPHMNWVTDTEECRQINSENVSVIIVDGTYTSMLSNADYKIYINTNYIDTRENRIGRNRETVTPFIENVLKRENEIISSQQDMNDIVVDGQFAVVKSNLT